MKKIFSILLISIFALVCGTNVKAQDRTLTPGHVKIIFKIKDYDTGAPISGVRMRVNVNKWSNPDDWWGGHFDRVTFMDSGTSDSNGYATIDATYTNWSNRGQFACGFIFQTAGGNFDVTKQDFQCDPLTAGYGWDTSVAGKIRNIIGGANGAVINKGAGPLYQDFRLSGEWVAQGAWIEWEVYLKDNTTTKTVSFDKTLISNPDSFPSFTVDKNTSIAASGQTIATPSCTNPNYTFKFWTLDGTTEYDLSTPVTSNIKLIPAWNLTRATVSFDTKDMGNPGSFTNFTVDINSSISASGHTIEKPTYKNDDMEFNYWSLDGSTQYDLSTPVTDNITLIPVWKLAQQDPDAKGIINFVVRIFDHDSYWRNPHFRLNSPITVNGVTCNYAAADYKSNDGWTTIAVDGLKFKLMSNQDKPGTRPEPILPVGTVSQVTTSNGTAQYVLDAAMLAKLNTGWVIDTDPDPDCLGTITRIGTQIEWCTFNWDLEAEAVPGPSGTTQQAGLLGSRYVKEGERHDNNGKIHISNNNENDVVKITTDMKRHGFEMTFYCYVVAAPTVQFDINGGTNPGFAADKYPIQKFKPVKSVGEDPRPNYKAVNPGNPIPPSNLFFTGWHEVIYNDSGEEYLDPSPFDFNKQLTKSVFVRATYTDALYEVRWAPETWTGESDNVPPLYEKSTTYENGSKAMYHAALPTKTGGNYTFDGWDLYEKDASGEKDFGALGKYKKTAFIPQSSMIEIQSTSGTYYQSPNAINGKNQIYVAHFLAGDTKLTISKSGLKSGDTALFTISDGATTMKLVLTGTGSTVNQTIILPNGGTWTVTEDMSWAWSYKNTEYSKTIEIAEGEEKSLSFTNTEKTGTVKHAEATVKNVFTKTK